jgi:hypothetical protein
MADAPVVHIGENSPEEVAYKLMERIAFVEGKVLLGMGTARPDRKWVLDTYKECLNTVRTA